MSYIPEVLFSPGSPLRYLTFKCLGQVIDSDPLRGVRTPAVLGQLPQFLGVPTGNDEIGLRRPLPVHYRHPDLHRQDPVEWLFAGQDLGEVGVKGGGRPML